MAKKKRGPRPPSKDQRRSEWIVCRMSKIERKMIVDAAKEAGTKLPEWIRASLISAAIASILEKQKDGKTPLPADKTDTP